MQRTMVLLQKKEQYAKKTLLESQFKWTNFSLDILNNCKDLIFAMDQRNIRQFTVNNGQMKNLDQIITRITKYDSFLQNNAKELSEKGLNINIPL